MKDIKILFKRNQKLIDNKKTTNEERSELIRDNKILLDAMEDKKHIKIRFENYSRDDKGRYHFLGWYPMESEEFCIDTKIKGKSIYKTYKWKNGAIEIMRYGTYIIEEVA